MKGVYSTQDSPSLMRFNNVIQYKNCDQLTVGWFHAPTILSSNGTRPSVISRFISGGMVGGAVGGAVGGMVGGAVGGATTWSRNKQPSGPSHSAYMFNELGNWFIGLPFHTPPFNHFNFLI